MSESFSEHRYYSLTPQATPKTGQSILEAGTFLLRIPGGSRDPVLPALGAQVPQPHDRTQPQTQHRRPLGPLSLPRLRLLASHELFGVLEGVLDTPATGESPDHLGRLQRHIGAEEEIVSFFAHRVPADDQQHGLLRDPVPHHRLGVDQTLPDLAPFRRGDRLPRADVTSHLFGGRQSPSFDAGTTALALLAAGLRQGLAWSGNPSGSPPQGG